MPAEQSKASSGGTTDITPQPGWRRRLLSPLNVGAVLILLFIWTFTFHQLTQERDRLIRDAQARTQVEAQAFGEYSLGSVRRVSEFLLDLRASWLSGRDVFEQVIHERQEAVRDLTFQVAVIDENGMLLYSSIGPTTERVDLSQREHFRVHKESGGRDVLFISDPVQGKVSKKWSIQFTRPILKAGQFAGVVVVSVSPEQFASFANTLAIGKDGAATIIRESGQILARVPNPSAGIEKPPRRRQFNKPGALETGSYRVVSGTDGIERLIGYHHVPEIGLYFLVGESVASVLEPYDGYRRTALVEATASTLLLALLYFTLRHQGAERKRHIEDMRLASMVYASSSEAMMVTTLDGRVIDVNPAFTVTTGYSAQEFKGQSSDAIRSECNERAVIEAMRDGVSTKGSWSGEYLIRRKDGSEFPALLTVDTFADSTLGEPRRVALIHDMTEKKRAEEVIWRQANFDALTDLPNRHMFYNRLRQEIARARQTSTQLALLFIDLDRFKEVNDTLGHDQGDILLKEIARRISAIVRGTDTVARLAGDEFTIILPDLPDASAATPIIRSLLARIAAPLQLGEESVEVSASIGVALYPRDADSAESLLVRADQAMFAAKSAGRNQWAAFTPALQRAEQERLRVTSDLRVALAQGQLTVHYQPIVDLLTGKVRKAEALIRWRHPVRGEIDPADFIPVAEDSGLIVEIGKWVLNKALDQLTEWHTTLDSTLQVSVNKSPLEFRAHQSGTESWPKVVERRGLPPHSLVVEITEGSLMADSAEVVEHLHEFRRAGVDIALDDFGTGYSSLSYLKRFDIDYIKIDQSFVRSLAHDPKDIALCSAIVGMAHALRIKVIAEGIETEEQKAILVAAGCDYGQGHLFCPPVPPAAFEAFVAKNQLAET
ncbi:EAL domain-containing protein [Ralstonia sp. NFACC01]|jgi:diguanylate cyclase (GGDEF)-like protein/PAS domain S-box-containing protein|uniref:bifunctional diguanylate cyclase/phosphodiesterase n=1 Tax=unclassified Ralstonia TaxID=209769 RepID=UPI0008DFC4B9|nr:EAL domain-containing protein [Ralstonia sp. NFACC01]SFP09310.1 diguanylate cyclase/phosphodiesterase [Ralstonia sp. NFACC01]